MEGPTLNSIQNIAIPPGTLQKTGTQTEQSIHNNAKASTLDISQKEHSVKQLIYSGLLQISQPFKRLCTAAKPKLVLCSDEPFSAFILAYTITG